jgi:hypothetical protein
MKPGDTYVHRETGVEVEVRKVMNGFDEVMYARADLQNGGRAIYCSPLYEFLEKYKPKGVKNG